jgi:hypothetical protein
VIAVAPSVLWNLFTSLKKEAPEAAIGIAAVCVMIFLITAATQFSSWEEYVCVGIGTLFGFVGVYGFSAAIYHVSSKKPRR